MSTTLIIILVTIVVAMSALMIWMRFKWFIYVNKRRRDIAVTPRRFLYSLYCLLLFIFLVYGIALPITIILFIAVWNKDKRFNIYHKFLRWSSNLIIKLLPDVSYTFNNKIGETFKNPGVIISNHQGHFDLMCIMMMTPNLIVLTNERVWRNPLYGWIIRLAGFHPVTNGLDYNLSHLKQLIQKGYSIVVFPEGTRSPECKILRFHTGAFHLAEQLGVDIIPVILHGVGHCIPKEDFMLRPGHMYLEVMERIHVKPTGDALYMRSLSREVRALYQTRYKQLQNTFENSGYFAKYVINKYHYIRPLLCHRISHILKHNDNYTSCVDYTYPQGSIITVYDNTFGALSWLLCLVHPNVIINAVITDTNMYKIAQSTPCIPQGRLNFVQQQPSIKSDFTITMSSNRSIINIDGK